MLPLVSIKPGYTVPPTILSSGYSYSTSLCIKNKLHVKQPAKVPLIFWYLMHVERFKVVTTCQGDTKLCCQTS